MLSSINQKLIQFMGSLPYIKKFFLLISVFSIPLIYSYSVLLSEFHNRTSFTKKEIMGVHQLEALANARKAIYQLEYFHRTNSITKEENKDQAQLATITSFARNQFDTLFKIGEQHQDSLKTHQLMQESRKLWKLGFLRHFESNEPAAYQQPHILEMHRLLKDLSKQVGDQSNLILDPDLDSYYLMDVVLITLTKLQTSLIQIERAFHIDLVMSSQRSTQAFEMLPANYAHKKLLEKLILLREDWLQLRTHLDTAFENSQTTHTRQIIQPELTTFNLLINQLIQAIERTATSDLTTKLHNLDIIHQSIQQSFKLWITTNQQLTEKLNHRVNGIYIQLYIFVFIALASLIVALALIYGFYQSVIKTVLRLDRSATTMLKGELDQPLEIETKDELGVVIRAFNQVLVRLKAEWLKAIYETEKAQKAELKAQQQKQEAQKLALIASRTINGVVITDKEGVVEWVNEGFERISGFSKSEIIGKRPGQLLQGKDTDLSTVAYIKEKVRNAEGVQADLINYNKAGEKYWIHLDVQPIFNDQGELVQFMGIETDITQRKVTEAALLRSEKLFKGIFNSAQDCVIGVNQDHKILFANPATETLFGYEYHELIHQNLDMLLPPKHRPTHSKLFSEYRHGRSTRMTNKVVHAIKRDGSLFPIDVSLAKVQLDNECILTAIVRDVTQQQEYENKLQNALIEIESILDASTLVAMIATDTKGKVTVFNTGAERMLGYRAEEMIGRTPSVIHLDDEVFERGKELSIQLGKEITGFETFVALPKRGQYEEREWSYVRKDGNVIQVSLSITAIKDNTGEITGFLGVSKDITEQKASEQRLVQETERANEMAQQAHAANIAKSQFLANMSHEIRTPMNGVLGMSQLLKLTNLNAKQKEYLNAIQSSGEMLLTILNDILDFSKIEAGKLSIEHSEFDLHSEVLHIARLFNSLAEEKGLEVILNLSADMPRAYMGDVVRIKQVLTNLVSNAVKFTTDGHVLITISAHKTAPPNYQLKVSVEDTGIGIPEDKLGALFSEFTQADSSTTRKYGGTGLGLSISKKLIELMGGQLNTQSTMNKGSCFSFELELASIPARAPSPEYSLAGLKALIIDDNDINLTIFHEQLSHWQMKTRLIKHPKEAIKALQSETFDVVLLDYMMPERNGIEVLEEIRKYSTTLPVLLLSSAEIEDTHNRIHEDPHTIIGLKPIDTRQLEQSLHKATLNEEHNKAETLIAHEEHPDTEEQPKLPQFEGRILLVEDTLINQMLGQELLQQLGLEVSLANHGKEALELLEQHEFDLIFMDCLMPVMDGYETTQQIRRNEQHSQKHQPICALTANALQDAKQKCLDAGMDDFVSKPFKQHELTNALMRWLKPS